jgi:hypothetical protein
MIFVLEFKDVLEIQDDNFARMVVEEGVDAGQDVLDLGPVQAVNHPQRL